MNLPETLEISEFIKNYRLQPQHWLEAVSEICITHQIAAENLITFTDGSNLIASVNNQYVVKIFPPFHRHQWESEFRALQYLNGKVSIPIPQLIAHGERPDLWTYLIITKLPGVTLESIWETYNPAEQIVLLKRIGEMMAEIQAVDVGDLISLEPDWNIFLSQQQNNFQKRHEKNGMPDWFIQDSVNYVKQVIPLFHFNKDLVILTGEYTPFNLLVTGKPGDRKISGMIDFGDAMIGYREYDFLGPLMFLCAGKADLIKSLLDGYGYTESQQNKDLRRRLIGLQILHRFSNFKRQLRITDWQQKVQSMEELEELIWPL